MQKEHKIGMIGKGKLYHEQKNHRIKRQFP